MNNNGADAQAGLLSACKTVRFAHIEDKIIKISKIIKIAKMFKFNKYYFSEIS